MRCRQYSPPRSSLYSLAVLVALPLVLLGGAAHATGLPEGAVGALGGIAQEMASCTDGTGTAAGFAEELRLKLTAAVASGNLLLSLLLVLLAGFGVTLTPCVYPLIPITLSLFGARSSPTKLAGFLLSLTYVSGMVLLYSGLGIGFALAGKVMGAAMQHPVVTAGVALFCLTMAASMFGAFELALPPAAQQRLAQVGGSGFRGAFLMGLVAGLIAAPCTGPVLSFILTLIAVDGDIGRGALFMVVFSLGVGLPFLVLGTFSSAVVRIPKTGAWTEAVKGIFGLLMVAAGLYFLTLGAPALVSLLGHTARFGVELGLTLLVVGAAIGGLHLSFKYTSAKEKGRKAAGLALCLFGVASLLGVATAGTSRTTDAVALRWQKVASEAGALGVFEATLARAKAAQMPVMIDFFAEWCAACKELDKYTYTDEGVQAEAARFVSVKVDATEDTPDLQEIQRRFGVVGLPTIAFLNSSGQVCSAPRVTGFVEPDQYLPLMRGVR